MMRSWTRAAMLACAALVLPALASAQTRPAVTGLKDLPRSFFLQGVAWDTVQRYHGH